MNKIFLTLLLTFTTLIGFSREHIAKEVYNTTSNQNKVINREFSLAKERENPISKSAFNRLFRDYVNNKPSIPFYGYSYDFSYDVIADQYNYSKTKGRVEDFKFKRVNSECVNTEKSISSTDLAFEARLAAIISVAKKCGSMNSIQRSRGWWDCFTHYQYLGIRGESHLFAFTMESLPTNTNVLLYVDKQTGFLTKSEYFLTEHLNNHEPLHITSLYTLDGEDSNIEKIMIRSKSFSFDINDITCKK